MKKTLIFAMAAVLLMALGSTPCYGQKTKKSSKKVENSVSYEEGSPAWTLRDFYDAYHKMDARRVAYHRGLTGAKMEREISQNERMFARDKDERVLYKDGELQIYSVEMEDADNAYIEASLSMDGKTLRFRNHMGKVDGVWKVGEIFIHKDEDSEALKRPDVVRKPEETKPVQQTGAKPIEKAREKIIDVKGTKLVMRFVEGGAMTMGKGQNTMPVELTYNYWVSETEVTCGLWNTVMGSRFQNTEWPIEVRWVEAEDFAKRLRNLTGKNIRLITEAEWEYAARYQNGGLRFSGSNNLMDVWRDENCGVKEATATALNKPNFLGIYGMNSKGGEWCSDYYYEKYPAGKQVNYQGPKTPDPNMKGVHRVVRGTGDKVFPERAENTSRAGSMENVGTAHIRLALTDNDVTESLKIPPTNFPKNPVKLPDGMAGNWRGGDSNAARHFAMTINNERKVLDAVDNKIGYGYIVENDRNPFKYYVITKIVYIDNRTVNLTYEGPDDEKTVKTMKVKIGMLKQDMEASFPDRKNYFVVFRKSLVL